MKMNNNLKKILNLLLWIYFFIPTKIFQLGHVIKTALLYMGYLKSIGLPFSKSEFDLFVEIEGIKTEKFIQLNSKLFKIFLITLSFSIYFLIYKLLK